MTLVQVHSSNLAAAGYEPLTGTLTIAFHGGRVYRYFAVPWEIYAGLMAAPSHGRYFHRFIRGSYPYQRIA